MKLFKLYAPLLVSFALLCMPLLTLAAQAGDVNNGPFSPGVVNNPTASPGVTGNSATIGNPLKVTNFCDLIKIVLQAIIMIGLPIAVVILVWVGFKFILAQGNPEKISDAQKAFLHTVIGIAIFLGAWAIAKIIASTLQNLGVSAVNECTR